MTRVLNSGPSIYVGESRSELLSWVNDLLHLNITKIEQMGTGSVYCQIFDSIYGDVPMNKVKFDTVQEYEYVSNFKILQSCFIGHKIDKYIPVEKLIKLKFQDNIEFMQWVKKFWDANFQNPDYDALGRRKGGVPTVAGGTTPVKKTATSTSRAAAATGRVAPTAMTAGSKENISSNNSLKKKTLSTANVSSAAKTSELMAENEQLRATIGTLENVKRNAEDERQFYYRKLRRIEMLLQDHEADVAANPILKSVEAILFSTEDPDVDAVEPTF